MKHILKRLWRRLTSKTPPPATPEKVLQGPLAPQRLPAKPMVSPPRRERSLIVGVDFGTSSTKVMWQDLSDNHFEVLRWGDAEDGEAAFLLPSAIVIRGGALHFGVAERDVCDDDIRLSSIKLCMLCRNNPAICRCASPVARYGMVHLPGMEPASPAAAIACLFLANAFREVERRLEVQFPDEDLLLLWNIGCPMDYLDEADRKVEWERMTGAAMELRRDVSNPASISVLTDVAIRLESFTVPAVGERNYYVEPEGLAAVKAFLESPHAESKSYAIVDVGAGTTEVSFFFNGRIMTEPGHFPRPSYLADSTRPIGGGKIDLELAKAWNCGSEHARRRKEAMEPNIPAVQTIRDICAQYHETCCEILRHRRLTAANDKHFDLFVIGGGGRLRPLQDALRGCTLRGGFVRDRWRQLEPPRSLKDRLAIQKDYDLFANACGLASSIDWEYYPPHKVPAMPSAPEPRPRVDANEFYPK
jgi:hypothetical protein